ncbi:MAG: metallophosphoesterase [Bifidobacteriaceae bacterium]|jgi:hypothetical protein|nr:metallophosphoesterase [Bifidobacteriaceae bacterium]
MRRRIWLWGLYGLLLAAPALFIGLVTARVEYPFGPHQAVYELTVDSRLTVDLGPLGAVVMPSPAPSPLGFVGARVAVGAIPADLTSASLSVNTLARDLTEYGQAYLGIDQTVRQAAFNLAGDGVIRAGIAWGSEMSASLLVALLLGRSRRTQLRMWFARRRRLGRALVAAVVAFGMAVGGGVVWLERPRQEFAPEPLLEGTPLAGAHLTGRVGQLLGDYGGVAVKAYEDNVAFYRAAAANVEEAFAAQALAAAERDQPSGDDTGGDGGARTGAPSSGPMAAGGPGWPSGSAGGDEGEAGGIGGGASAGVQTSGDVGEEGIDGLSSSGDEGAKAADGAGGDQSSGGDSPAPTPPWRRGAGPYGDLKPALFFSDLHCNVGMAEVMGAAARALKTELVLDGGDTTVDGTAVERYCVDQIAAALPDGATWVTSTGNHDTAETAKQEAAAGALVLAGKVVKVAGLRILGDHDPTHTEVGLGTSLTGGESPEEVGQRLAEVACADESADLLVVHRPAMAEAALDAGCVPAAVSGHMHSRAGPKQIGRGIFYQQASTGRDNADGTNLGPLANPSELTILLFDSDGRIAAWQLLTINPDASAKLSKIKPWPALAKPVEPASSPRPPATLSGAASPPSASGQPNKLGGAEGDPDASGAAP